ncbi:LytR C-terminal domain-containing protein [Corynebacterium uberis]
MSDVNENYGRSRRHRDGGRDDYSDDHHYSDEPAYEGYEGYDDYDDYADDSYAQEGYEDAGYAGAAGSASAYAASDYADADYDEDAAAELDADERPARINVLNNSTVPDLAANTSRQFTEQGAHVGEVGNLPEEQLKVERTTVFYHPGNADAQHRAEELAARVGGEAQPYNPALPPATAGDNDITLVLAGPVAP